MRHDDRPHWRGCLLFGLLVHAFACSSERTDAPLAMTPAGGGAAGTNMPSPEAGRAPAMPDPPPRDAGRSTPSKPNNPNDAGQSRTPNAPAAAEDDAGTAPAALPAHCSGCAGEQRNAADMTIHLHHVHLKSADRERSVRFY